VAVLNNLLSCMGKYGYVWASLMTLLPLADWGLDKSSPNGVTTVPKALVVKDCAEIQR
jgi:hypothetical protein